MFNSGKSRRARRRRELLLVRAGAALASATSREGVEAVAVDTVLGMLPSRKGARATLFRGDEHAMTFVAAAGDDAEEVLGLTVDLAPVVRDRLLRGEVINATHVTAEERAASPVPAKLGGLFSAPLFVHGRLSGALMVTANGRLPRAFEDSFCALASHVALALERAELIDGLRRSEERFRALVQHASDLITVLDLEGRIKYQSPSIERILGYPVNGLVGSQILDIVHPDDVEASIAFFIEALKHGEVTAPVRWRVRHADGSWRHLETIYKNLTEDDNVGGMLLTGRDVSDRKELEDQLAHRAFHDSLTGLPNRALFTDRVEHALARQTRTGSQVAVLFLDVDDFKTVNDSLGHAAGDRLLVEIAGRLDGCLRGGDTAARLGGDEFAVLVESIDDPREAAAVAERVIEALRPAFEIDGKRTFVYASGGIALSSGKPGERAEELLRNADVAMYIAKRRGKGGYEFFEPGMHAAALKRLELKAELEQALEREEFVVHYQPAVDLASGSITSVEALVRWSHPQRGLVPPLDFIPLAEETGLIVPIGRWVLQEACSRARAWQLARPTVPPLSVAVNLSGRQLQDGVVVDEVTEALESTGLPAANLILEITETVLLQDADGAAATLAALKELGVQLAIDDFGTGYSSLGYLDRFPVDIVKIAKPFIDGVAHGPDESALAAAMITLGGTLGLKTVAEGIEDAEQLAELRALACDQGQGFYLARPVAAEGVDALLAAGELPAPA
ncbi:MAG TPA: EAL domain-containing protein [Thermoleophilaceae bacterium]|nr:EAL domain-containing protein [Thermoleophilaceae bacterium]